MTAERSSEDNDGHQVRATIAASGSVVEACLSLVRFWPWKSGSRFRPPPHAGGSPEPSFGRKTLHRTVCLDQRAVDREMIRAEQAFHPRLRKHRGAPTARPRPACPPPPEPRQRQRQRQRQHETSPLTSDVFNGLLGSRHPSSRLGDNVPLCLKVLNLLGPHGNAIVPAVD